MNHNTVRFTLILAAIFFLSVGALKAQSKAVIVYVNTGVSYIDQTFIKDCGLMVDRLNSGGTSVSRSYSLTVLDTFESAMNLNSSPPSGVGQVILVCHGVFNTDGSYSGNLDDTKPESTPEGDVQGFVKQYHCNADRKVNADQIGADISAYNYHPYSHTSSAPMNTNSGGTPSYWGSAGMGSGYWVVNQGSYTTWDGTTLTIHTFTYAVFVQSSGGPYDEDVH